MVKLLKIRKVERQKLLQDLLEKNPFLTDEELAKQFSVSVQTIRLDRLECGIPELRKRLEHVATQTIEGQVKSLYSDEVIGDIIDIKLDETALSIFDVTEDHVFQRNGIARGHHLFAQANSLAVAVLDDDLALTANSDLEFLKPVRMGDRIVAKAEVKRESKIDNRTLVEVTSTVNNTIVFKGSFYMYRNTKSKPEEL